MEEVNKGNFGRRLKGRWKDYATCAIFKTMGKKDMSVR
jgi:hypothetical protein